MGKYGKAITSVVLATLVAVVPLMQSGPLTVTSQLLIGVAFLSALLVYLVPNLPQAPAFKTGVTAFMAGVAFLVTVVSADCPSLVKIFSCVAMVNWIQCAVIALKAGGVYLVPNSE